MRKIILIAFLFVISISSYAQISSYAFSQSTNVYTEITGGTLLGNETTNNERFVNSASPLGSTSVLVGDGFPIGFNFTFNGEVYDRFAVMADGWISFGKSTLSPSVNLTSTSTAFPLNSTEPMHESNLARIAGFSLNMGAQAGATLRFETIGTAPNRTLVVQWKDYRRSNQTGDLINFQIRLEETTNNVSIVYGNVSTASTSNVNVQVGLRATPIATVVNYLCRKSATSWSATTVGTTTTIANEFVNFTNLIAPPSGLTFTFTPPACSAPAGFSATAITNSGVTLNWEAISPAPTGYEYVLSTTNVAPTVVGTTTTFATNVITTLQSNTIYYVYLRTNCGSVFSDWSYVGLFKTLCDSVTDFVQNFDNFPTGTGNLPDCWSKAGSSNNVYTTSLPGAGGTAPNRLYMNINATNTAFAIMPFVSNLQANTHRLRFKAQATAVNKTLKVGYFTNPSDVSTFVEIGETTILPNSFNFDVAQEYTIIPNNIPAGISQLVFTMAAGSSTTIYVDDVKWELNSTCIEPTTLTANAITNATAQLGWSSGDATAWEIQYGPVNFQLGTGTVISNVTTNPHTITGLTASTSYQFYVRGVCAGPINSAWAGPFRFKTTCDLATSFTENFNSYTPSVASIFANCWDKGGVIANVGIVQISGLSNQLSINALSSVSGTQTISYAMMPPVSNLQAASHRLRFKAYTSSMFTDDGKVEIGYLTDSYDVSTFVYLTDYTFPKGIENQEQYIYEPYALPATAKRLVFRMEGLSTVNGMNIFVVMDDIYWEAIPTCLEPYELMQSNVLSNTATITWSEPSSAPANGYEYYVSTSNTEPTIATVATETVAAGITTTSIPNLIPSTQYYVWVRSVCSLSDKSYWTDFVTFKTLCAPVTTITETFEGYATGSSNPLPNCWDKLGTIANVYITTGSVTPGSPPNRLFMSASATSSFTGVCYAALPSVSNLQADTHRLRFKAYTTSGPNRILEIGYLTDAYNVESFVPLTEVSVPELAVNATEFFYSPGALPATAVRLVFKNASIPTAVTDIYVDDVYWEPIPACLEVSNIIASNFQLNGGTVSWNAPLPAPSNGYEYYYSTTNVAPTSASTPSGDTPAGSTIANLTGLTASTQYFVWVRSVCSSGTSLWSGPISFFTECSPITSFVENFSTSVTPSLPTCWSKILRGGTTLSPFAYVRTSNVNVGEFPNFTTPNYVVLSAQGSSAGADIILVSPKVSNLGAGTHRLKLHSYYTGDIEIGTLNNNDPNTAVFTPLQTISLVFSGSFQVVDFTSYTGTNTYIGIRLVPNQDLLPTINLDNIIWEPIPLCSDVTQVTVTPGATTANVTWVAGSASETSWEVAVGASTVTDPNTLTALPAATTSLIVPDLIPNTPYKAWVRAICGANIGNWIMTTFTTNCGAQNVPYTENFELASTPALPACTSEITVGFGNNWQTQSWSNSGFSSKVLRNPNPPGEIMNSWFFTNGVNLVQGQTYSISYKIGTTNGFTFHSLKSTFGTSASIAAMTTTIADHVTFAGNATTQTTSFTVPTTGVYYFGFHGYGGTSGTLYVDDITVDVNLSNGDFDLANFSYYPNPVSDVLTVSYNNIISEITAYNLLGQQVLQVKPESTIGQLDMSKLSQGTYMVRVTSENQVKTFKVIKN